MHPATEEANNDAVQIEMPKYRCHKEVWALEIDSVFGNKLTFRDKGYASITCDPTMFLRGIPTPGDFYIVYEDGYKSFSPAKAFKEGYKRLQK